MKGEIFWGLDIAQHEVFIFTTKVYLLLLFSHEK